jgi:DNA-binding GntR family transcriptional regulator
VRTWLDWHGLHEAAKRVKPADVERARALRTRFDRVFDAQNEDEAVDLLNRRFSG